MIEPLSALDAAFLYAETPTTPMNVMATIVLQGPIPCEDLIERIEARLPALPPFRRRLVEIPFGLDHPAWVEDPNLDAREHVTRVSVPEPGDDLELERVVARLARQRLDRARPLWKLVVVDGLAGDRSALVVCVHHAAMDGVSGAALLLQLFDREGEDGSPASTSAGPSDYEAEPDLAELVRYGISRVRKRPRRLGRGLFQAGRTAQKWVGLRRGRRSEGRPRGLPFAASRSPFNGPLSSRRSIGYSRTSFDAAQRVRDAFGGTLNDVVLTACTGALRSELIERRAPADGPLLAAVPVSTRPQGGERARGNHLSAILVELPVQLEDPIRQLSEVRATTFRAKQLHAAFGDDMLGTLAELATPRLAMRAFDLYGRWKLASLHRPLVNLMISNVPGPPTRMRLLGRPVAALYPHGPLMEGVGLNVTILSYAGAIDIGVQACAERAPGAHRFANRISASMEQLDKLAETTRPDVPPLSL